MSKKEKLEVEKAIKMLMDLQQDMIKGDPAVVLIHVVSPIIRKLKTLTS
jgi:hypothetical protein